MTTKKHKSRSRDEIAIDMVCGVTAALTYSDEEIYNTLPKEDAEEFIRLRNEVKSDMQPGSTGIKIGYGFDDEDLSLAAEDEASYE